MRRSSNSRQSFQALRVPDVRTALTTPQNKRTQNSRNLSMTKPASVSSERKTNFFGNRSSAGTVRTSQYGAFGSTEKMKDPRPLQDKTFIQQCIRQLCEFLVENGYAHNISVKTLQSPSTKDFIKIFAFIYSFLHPSYEIPDSKFEEEIPRIFKELGYPFPISKSSMFTVGAPHTWPHIVAALIWLTGCVKVHDEIQKNIKAYEDISCEDESVDVIEHNKLFTAYTSKCYDHYMSGEDVFDEVDMELCSKLKELYKVDESQVESLKTENKRLNEEIEKLEKEKESEPDRLASLKKFKASLETDAQKYQNYLTEVESHAVLVEQRHQHISDELEAIELEFEAVKEENSRLKNILDNQKYSVADIERIKYEENELQQTIYKLTKELDEDKQQLWNEELKFAKVKESIEANIAEYHKLARKLKLIPPTAENAKGHDFRIWFNPDGDEASLTHLRTQINVPLIELINKSEEEITKATNKKIALEDRKEQVNLILTEKRKDVKVLKEEAQKLDELYQQKLEEAEEEEKKWEAEFEHLEKHRYLLESGVNKGLDEVLKELQEAQAQYQLTAQQTGEEGRQLIKELNQIMESATFHVESIEAQLTQQCIKVNKDFEELKNDNLLVTLREVLEKYREKEKTLNFQEP
uniref:Kinetochore protein NDC80 n=1 Tax=Geotrypetes seraphini TaxID=260995 RepID=A0A6P8QA23_GEOSA|nr:kinetochore protein NDC80 homolog [Geotrypetes seraphini]XP_033796278.1 kinetochore protein NDC80 homolog [Geotrypetes seraphini]XP_033796279.1 kinetochore protein NDC80 homolog [Geotrypetes seraphini]XP_033796280.1 kinetochore protein NDC80 homolog [Geotrypetes seraphini]